MINIHLVSLVKIIHLTTHLLLYGSFHGNQEALACGHRRTAGAGGEAFDCNESLAAYLPDAWLPVNYMNYNPDPASVSAAFPVVQKTSSYLPDALA